MNMKRYSFLITLCMAQWCHAQEWNFNFGTADPSDGIPVDGSIVYDQTRGYGFEWSEGINNIQFQAFRHSDSTGIASHQPYVFSVLTGEGNFEVTARFATEEPDAQGLTIKAESRRLVVHEPDLRLQPQTASEVSFVTNVRSPRLAQGGEVKITHREVGAWHWDDALQMEVHSSFALLSLHIRKLESTPVLYLMGDSTVTDQTTEPWIGWGQMLPYFFANSIVVANHAESGETLKNFRAEGRLEKVMDALKPGDFVIIQFGHNDMKEKGEGIGAMTSYAQDLRYFIQHIRGAGAQPILVTAMKRRRFDEQGRQFATLGDYPLAVRKVAAEMAVPLVDLNFMSGVFYGALGPQDSTKAFVHYPAGTFPNQDKPLKDDTHFNAFGGYELANCVVEALKTACPTLASHLKPGLPLYDPSTPHDPASLRIPLSPRSSIEKPAGN